MYRSILTRCGAALLATCAFFTGLLSPAPLGAQERLAVEALEIGFGGRYKVGDWTPVWVTLRAGDAAELRVHLETADPDGQIAVFPLPEPVSLAPGRQRRVLGYVLPARLRPAVTVAVYAGEHEQASAVSGTRARPIARREFGAGDGAALLPALRQDETLIVTLGHPEGLEDGLASATRAATVVHLESAANLPDDWRGYGAVDVLVCATRTPWYQDLSQRQADALVQWVRAGGRIVVAAAEGAEPVAASFLAPLLPAQFDGPPYEARQLIYLEAYSESRVPLVIERSMPVANLTDVRGTVLASEGPRPLAVRAAYGFGQVTLVAFDVDRPSDTAASPFADWGGRGAFWQKLIEPPSGAAARSQGESLARLRISDLATQLRATIEDFPEVRTVSFGLVLFIGVLYLALAGPLDYLVVRRLLGRSGLMWLTLPVIVVAAVVVIYGIAARSKGTALRMNQVDLVDYDERQGLFRGNTWFALFSPRTQSFDFALATNWGTEAPNASLRWFGVPEESVGGLYSSGLSQLASSRYRIDSRAAAVAGVPVPVWSSRSYHGQWLAEEERFVESRLASPDGQVLEGTILLSGDYQGALEDVLLAYGRRVYEVGELSFGTAIDLRSLGRQRDLRGLLTGAFAVREPAGRGRGSASIDRGLTIRAAAYDPTATEIDSVMRMLLWHGAAGGAGYSGLRHQLLETADLSDHLDLDRAVLVGRWVPAPGAEPPATVLREGAAIDAEMNHTVYVRLLMPVERRAADETAEASQ